MAVLIIFILLCLLSFLCYSLFFIKPKDSRDGRDLPPSPPSLPIIGHLHLILLSTLTHKSFQRLSSKYGPLLHLRIFHVPIVLASSASVAYDIFRDQDVNVSFRHSPPIEESLFLGSYSFISAPYGDYWKFMRKLMVTKILGPQALERSRRFREDELDRFYKTLLDKAMKKESVEIVEEAAKLNNNTICKMIMGRSCSEETGEAERIRGLRRFLWNTKEKMEEHHQGTDMMDVLLEAYRDENAEYKITRNHIKSMFVDLFIAGTDTSSTTIQWIMAEIINHPKILERLREEIDFVVGKTRLIQETDLPNLLYLQAIIKEGLRLHPPGPLLPRTVQERCEIKGFHIPEKTILVVNSYAIMRDPDFWEDPDEFKPERFLSISRSGQEDEIRDKFLKYIPFASGRRGCPGTNLAYASVGTAVGVMVQCFDWKIEGEKVNMNEAAGTMVLTMAHPLKCTPVPRTLNR
ncbi:CYP705A2 [Arabidopsis thaliana]|uniref:CYP705A2 n=1 Tax=Arabidopsis thaliana TaxID=3702 RepID=A0A178UVQ6_ARATH|nr:CYP705A2 [Arabidopsis thaliana]